MVRMGSSPLVGTKKTKMAIKKSYTNWDLDHNLIENARLENLDQESLPGGEGQIALINGRLAYHNGSKIIYPEEVNFTSTILSSLSSIPTSYDYVLANLSSNQTISFLGSIENNKSVNIIVVNKSSSNITITIPSVYGTIVSYINSKCADSSLIVKPNESAELSYLRLGDNYFIRTSA